MLFENLATQVMGRDILCVCVLVKKYGHCDSPHVGFSFGPVSRGQPKTSKLVVAVDSAGHRTPVVAVPHDHRGRRHGDVLRTSSIGLIVSF